MEEEKDFPYYIEPKLKKKLDLMIQRLEKQDAWVVIDGDEGSGKTNMATYIMKYVSMKTGRPLKIENFFYDARQLMEYCQNNPKSIVNWDEAVLGGMSKQWWNKSQILLEQYSMTGRIHHHFITLCIPKFHRLSESFIKDRSIALITCYKRKNKEDYRFLYFNKRKKEWLYDKWRSTRRREYSKFKSFGGWIPEVFSKVFTEEQQQEYTDRKLKMIGMIGQSQEDSKESKEKAKMEAIKYNIAMSKELKADSKAEILGCSIRTIENMRRKVRNNPTLLGN